MGYYKGREDVYSQVDEANVVFTMGFSRLGMVLERVLLAVTLQSKFSVRAVSLAATSNAYGTKSPIPKIL